ncbi:hypothetical protein SYNPS1DRAFT_31491 [Syncephalis pseudoplumigaleata]|uniref:Uncharacterized protein n=1 Tax=Syncephalis pseudoplumigaleata TaxID=1712513 RepID=A0A4P9YSU7_9FUNG|nr:hypothetical protein SYNPS1DRAFT_31491 [Syncephalis pseudoplumigaleata]|eukprot:RKP22844.1 hypothetical protein SYNPS1DRAFT_31491 [Syncephalis pseudoplumigaleata]
MGKRKHSEANSVTCRVIEEKNGPALGEDAYCSMLACQPHSADALLRRAVTTPAVAPASDAVFHRYNNTTARRAHQSMVMCETDRVWFVGKNFGETQQTSLFCRYLVGVRDKRTNVLTLQPASVYPLEKTIKSLVHAKSMATSDQSSVGVGWLACVPCSVHDVG